MPIFKCKICGGELNIVEGSSTCECEYCGTKQTVPNINDEKINNLYDRANQLIRNCRFDEASEKLEEILKYCNDNPDIYWSILMCKYGVNYVSDPYSGRMLPTIHRYQAKSIFSNVEYEKLISLSNEEQKDFYETQAKLIDKIHLKFNKIINTEDSYEIFICYKQNDDGTKLETEDYKIAYDLYNLLTNNGYKVFFSHISLEDKIGEEYEPYIYAALNSSKLMLSIGTKTEYYNSTWVKNEWSRFLSSLDSDKKLIPICPNSSILPKEFSRLQCVQMDNSIVWKEELLRQIDILMKRNVISDGQKIAMSNSQETANNSQKLNKKTNEQSKTEDNKKKPNKLLIVASVLAVIVVAIVAVSVINNKKGSVSINNESTAEIQDASMNENSAAISNSDNDLAEKLILDSVKYTEFEKNIEVVNDTIFVTIDGYNTLINGADENAKNKFGFYVDKGEIQSFEVVSFGDNEFIGGNCFWDLESDWSFQIIGKKLYDDIDVYSGATYTSRSFVAAASAALEYANR